VSDFLSKNNVVTNSPSFNKRLLRRINIIRLVRIESISKAFSNNFVDDVVKGQAFWE
jgi:hypothetical protein